MIINHASPISSEAVALRENFRETETRIAIGLGAVLLVTPTLESEFRAKALEDGQRLLGPLIVKRRLGRS
jgi:hypothetical protein